MKNALADTQRICFIAFHVMSNVHWHRPKPRHKLNVRTHIHHFLSYHLRYTYHFDYIYKNILTSWWTNSETKLPAAFAYCFSTGTHYGKAIGWNWMRGRKKEPNKSGMLGIECIRGIRWNYRNRTTTKNDRNEIPCDFTCVHDLEGIILESVWSRDTSVDKRT